MMLILLVSILSKELEDGILKDILVTTLINDKEKKYNNMRKELTKHKARL